MLISRIPLLEGEVHHSFHKEGLRLGKASIFCKVMDAWDNKTGGLQWLHQAAKAVEGLRAQVFPNVNEQGSQNDRLVLFQGVKCLSCDMDQEGCAILSAMYNNRETLTREARSALCQYKNAKEARDKLISHMQAMVPQILHPGLCIAHLLPLYRIILCAESDSSRESHRLRRIAKKIEGVSTAIQEIIIPILTHTLRPGDISFWDSEKRVRAIQIGRPAGDQNDNVIEVGKGARNKVHTILKKAVKWFGGRIEHAGLTVPNTSEGQTGAVQLSDCASRSKIRSLSIRRKQPKLSDLSFNTWLRLSARKLLKEQALHKIKRRYSLSEEDTFLLVEALFEACINSLYEKEERNLDRTSFSLWRAVHAYVIPQIFSIPRQGKTALTDSQGFCSEHVARFIMRSLEDVQELLGLEDSDWNNPFLGCSPDRITPEKLHKRFSEIANEIPCYIPSWAS